MNRKLQILLCRALALLLQREHDRLPDNPANARQRAVMLVTAKKLAMLSDELIKEPNDP